MSWVETARNAVEEIKRNRENEDLVEDFVKSAISEKMTGSITEASHIYKKQGWVRIFSGYLNKSIYLVKDETVKVPDPSILKYTQHEIEALRDLSIDELKTLCYAKEIFFGAITKQ